MATVALLIGLAAEGAGAQDGDAEEARHLLITDVTIVSPAGEGALQRGNILISDGRIVQVSEGPLKVPERALDIVDGTGLFAIPGLIDSHVHLASIPGMRFDQINRIEGLSAEYFNQVPRSYLYYGYTDLIDLGAGASFIERLPKGDACPTIRHSDKGLVFANGYPMMFEPPEESFRYNPNFLYDESNPDSIPAEYAPEDHTPEACVQRAFSHGAIGIKTYYDRGFPGGEEWPNPSVELMRSVVRAAHERDLPVLMHANSLSAYRFALESGVDITAHGLWHWDDKNNLTSLDDELKQLLDEFVKRKIGVMPTMQVVYGERALFDPEFLNDDKLAQVMPQRMLDWYRTEEGGWFARNVGALHQRLRPGADSYELDSEFIKRLQSVVKYLADHDGRLLFGTDTPSSPTWGNPIGYNGYLEMQRWVEAGVTPARVLRAATIDNARAFGLEDELGTIEAGKVANLVLLGSNPLESVEAFDQIRYVVLRGRLIERATLAATYAKTSVDDDESPSP